MSLNSLKDTLKKDFLGKLEVSTCYQPIVHLVDGRVIGLEALSRFKFGGSLVPAIKIFQIASDLNLVTEIDCLCRELAMRELPVGFQGYLFLNTFPDHLNSTDFHGCDTVKLAEEYELDPKRIALEIAEVERVKDINLLRTALDRYKRYGFLLCIDDLGIGYNSLQVLLELEGMLDFIKLPRELVAGSARSKIKYQLLKVLSEMSLNIGAKVIYEGVEHEEDLKLVVQELGGQYAQGYYFSKPLPGQEVEHLQIKVNIKWAEKNLPEGNRLEVLQLDLEERFGNFLRATEKLAHRYVVLQLGQKEYLIDLWKLKHSVGDMEKNLYYYKPLKDVVLRMDGLFLELDSVPQLTTETLKVQKLYHALISSNQPVFVRREGGEIYLVEKHLLVKYLYERLSQELLQRNPLTQLPGNTALQEKAKEFSEFGQDFWACYVDLDNFKAFNDAYGFYAGDQMIKKVGVILSSFAQRMEGKVFVGHVGGDDFVLLIRDIPVEELVRELLELLRELQEGLLEFYSPEDRQRGYFVGKDREEKLRQFPLATVSMALVKGSPDMVDISKRCAQLKRKAKSHPGSALAVEHLNQILTISS
ncbi:MAG: GGDEF domain-containing protein [Aquificaceae bacterium]|nr:GGDEF domain-containing protein [Aquificaceae bacterium]MDW8097078.1 GGDEF domain-containing protein [Aquificaceae bacterium]